MATFDRNLNMFKTSDGLYFATQADATAHEQQNAPAPAASGPSDDDFAANQGQSKTVIAPKTAAVNLDPTRAAASNARFKQGYTDLNSDGYIDQKDVDLAAKPYGTPEANGGTAAWWQGTTQPLNRAGQTMTALRKVGADGLQTGELRTIIPAQAARGNAPAIPEQSGVRYDGGNPSAPNFQTSPGSTSGATAPLDTTSGGQSDPATATADAKNESQEVNAENDVENAKGWSNVWDHYDNLDDPDNALGDEARGYQREGLQQQRMLLEKLLGFDPNQYASQFADQSLARTIAAGRSTPGGAAAQQQGMFAAMDQAPSLYAEGARQASSLENQRLGAAQAVTKSFGDLGTMTRGQDEARTQFESTLSLTIADSIAKATQGQVSLNEAESQRFAQVYMDFAQLQSVYAGMDSNEQIHQLDLMFKGKELDAQWAQFKAQMNAAGSVSAKDIIGGLFQLGGGVISAGGSILAAGAKNAA